MRCSCALQAFGNIGTNAMDAAQFFYDLLGRQVILNATSVKEMRRWGSGMVNMGLPYYPYGLGIWQTDQLSINGGAEGTVNKSYPGIGGYTTYAGQQYISLSQLPQPSS